DRGRPDRVDIALKELPETAFCQSIGAPDRLNLIAFEKLRELVLILRDDARQRNRQVISKRELRFAACFMFASLQNLEDQLVAFVAVLSRKRLDILERRRFNRFETVALVHVTDHTNHVLSATYVVGQKIPSASRRLCGRHHLL